MTKSRTVQALDIIACLGVSLTHKHSQLADLEQQIASAPNKATRNMLEGRAIGLLDNSKKIEAAMSAIAKEQA